VHTQTPLLGDFQVCITNHLSLEEQSASSHKRKARGKHRTW